MGATRWDAVRFDGVRSCPAVRLRFARMLSACGVTGRCARAVCLTACAPGGLEACVEARCRALPACRLPRCLPAAMRIVIMPLRLPFGMPFHAACRIAPVIGFRPLPWRPARRCRLPAVRWLAGALMHDEAFRVSALCPSMCGEIVNVNILAPRVRVCVNIYIVLRR